MESRPFRAVRAAAVMSGLVAGLLLPLQTAPTAAAAEPHVDNPFVEADLYLNPDYTDQVETSMARTADETLRARMGALRFRPTAVWMDRIAAIHGGDDNSDRLSLRGHLDQALAQAEPGRPITATFVIYNLPGRDCAALASNGELPLTQEGLARYQHEYIDAITGVMGDPAYAGVRIVAIIEPDGLPNLVTNQLDPQCAQAKSSGIQVEAVRYALDALHALPNVYTYMDIAHSGWLGWDDNLRNTVDLYTEVAQGTEAGLASVDGFATNVANYTPSEEPYLPDPELRLNISGLPVRSSSFYEWNPVFDETDFAVALWDAFRARGWPETTGMLIDTSRNGWGGEARPTGPGAGDAVDTYVRASAVDRRGHRGLWCNVAGAGLGRAPQAAPAGHPEAHLDAFVWVKPPGESDGASQEVPNDEGKHADPMCDPEHITATAGKVPTGALADAPLAGHWFHEQFAMLIRNSYPAVPASADGTDTLAPSAPSGLRGLLTRSASVTLGWGAAVDDGVVAGYDIYRDGIEVTAGPVPDTTFTDAGLEPGTSYTYVVRARDEAGNVSAPSAPFTVTTQPDGAATGDLEVLHRDNDASPGNNAIRPGLSVRNTSSVPVDLSDVTVRYWFTRDGSSPVSVWCDHAVIGCGSLTYSVVETATPLQGADAFIDIGFTGGTLSPGAETGAIEVRVSKADWSDFDETDDHSHRSGSGYLAAPTVTAYLDGSRAWGSEPS
ncbi:glycoside hydrolase family 6 protein [Streptomyces sp. HK10]|uniref:glycoside hydrolase family 6 protein n=1 Tax=Streptomyces sp. HK10 TaxID=3373255 RepID=UPI003747A51A